ncbi:MAG: type II toxin-antitoxin system YafQ family toxin [Nitrospirae bacterium]|nr:type II toxin-antitoxin system YafQ family toxin [Nitrospirota bacterium]
MLIPAYTKRFKRDLDLILKRGKDKEKIKAVAKRLIEETGLEDKHRVHKLSGEYIGRMECHIEPDWLLVYRVNGDEIIFERTGSHSDLFT